VNGTTYELGKILLFVGAFLVGAGIGILQKTAAEGAQ
jgi:hypothetical protein